MTQFFAEVRDTLFPRAGSRDGALPPLLVALTFVTGLVDAFSYLVLGHVFVANMTGNVVFLGFALAGAPGFSIGAASTALALFVLGALVGGRLARRLPVDRRRLMTVATGLEGLLVAVAVGIAFAGGSETTDAARYGLIAALALAMGVQNAAARRLAVPELTTTVLTMTMTGLAADSRLAGDTGSQAGRRLTAVAAMFLGALVGASLVLDVRLEMPLIAALAALLVVVSVSVTMGPRARGIDPSAVGT